MDFCIRFGGDSGGGIEPKIGKAAMAEFWFPEGALPSEVSRFDRETLDIIGNDGLAAISGRSVLEFTYDGQSVAKEGNYTILVVLNANGDWKIQRMIWNIDRSNDSSCGFTPSGLTSRRRIPTWPSTARFERVRFMRGFRTQDGSGVSIIATQPISLQPGHRQNRCVHSCGLFASD